MSGEELDGSDKRPSGGRSGGLLEVFGEAVVSVEPCQSALDHPSARKEFAALGCIGSVDDLDGPFADAAQGGLELLTCIPC